MLEQTPHSMSWDYDAMGYIAMGIATFCASQAITGPGFARRVRFALYANALTTPLIATAYFYPRNPDYSRTARRSLSTCTGAATQYRGAPTRAQSGRCDCSSSQSVSD